MRYARIMGLASLVLNLAAPLAAQATLSPDVTQRLQIAAYESRAFDQRDIAMAQQLNSGELLSCVARNSGSHASAAMCAAVIGSISENPALAGEIVATAVACTSRDRSPRRAYRPTIWRQTTDFLPRGENS